MKQITAKHCARSHPYLPDQRGNVRIPNIIFINAVLYVMENGCRWYALPKRFVNWSAVHAWFRRWSRSGVLEHLFAALREQQAVGEGADCFGLDSTGVKVHPDGTGARETNGPQSIGKSRGGRYAKIHMVLASDRQAMIFACPAGRPTTRPKARVSLESSDKPVANVPLAMDRAYEGKPESQMGLRQGSVQAAERGRTAVPKTQGLPAHLHAVREARRDASRLPKLRSCCRNDTRFSINRS